MKTYRVVFTHTEEGYSASCPDLPGCHSEGATKEEAPENITPAINEYLAAVVELKASNG